VNPRGNFIIASLGCQGVVVLSLASPSTLLSPATSYSATPSRFNRLNDTNNHSVAASFPPLQSPLVEDASDSLKCISQGNITSHTA
jgi:hypothetical protein